MTAQPQYVSVTRPVGQAVGRVKQILFQPFDLGKWFVIGFCAWLANLGQRGSSFNYHTSSGDASRGKPATWASAHAGLDEAKIWLVQNLYWLLPVVIVAVLLVLALGALLLWLNSRGKFMFLHCVALNRAEVVAPWRRYVREANSLFRFQLVFCLCGFAAALLFVGGAGVVAVHMIQREAVTARDILAFISIGFGIFFITIAYVIIGKFTTDFVVPWQFRHGGGAVAAWGAVLRLIGPYSGEFILYLLFSFVLAIAIGVLTLAAIVGTCCVSCCVLVMPYLGTVLLLPVFIFWRAYSAYFFAQFGPDCDVFAPAAPPP